MSEKMSSERYFSRDEAEGLLGKTVLTAVDGHRLRKGTAGTVRYMREAEGGYEVGVEWHISPQPWVFSMSERWPFLTIERGPDISWFRRDQWHYIEECLEL